MWTFTYRSARLLLIAALITSTVGCSDGADDAGPPSTGNIDFVSSELSQVSPDVAAASSAAAMINAAGADLYGQLRDRDGNLALSPYSIVVALAMARAGAEGPTGAEMDTIVHAAESIDLHRSLGSLDAVLSSREGSFPIPDGDPLEIQLRFANAVWPQRGFSFESDYLDLLASSYGAGVHAVDYAGDASSARETINQWVSDQTRDRIPEFLPEGVLDALTRLVLTNAVYLNAPWLHPFEQGGTTETDFTLLDGTSVRTPMMRLDADIGYASEDGWQAVRLPYIGGELAMIVAVSEPGTFETVDAALDAGWLAAIQDHLEMAPVRLRLPRWEFRSQLPLNDTLRDLGMSTAFSSDADFSRLSPEPLSITDVIHEAFIAVDEEGTEAAAATAVVIGESAAPGDVVELTVDRPFHFWIVDQPTGAVLFLGRVMKPEAA